MYRRKNWGDEILWICEKLDGALLKPVGWLNFDLYGEGAIYMEFE